ncbi:MAG: CoA pyrophosphatase [Litorimonas sp.]
MTPINKKWAMQFADDPVIENIRKALLPAQISDGADEVKRDGQRGAAVFMLLVNRPVNHANNWQVILTQRPETMPSHPGQIAFPGGKREAGETIVQTALRETREEIGIKAQDIDILGRLPSFNTASHFRITPFVGLASPKAAIIPDPREVDEVFEVPLEFLMNEDNHKDRIIDYTDKKFHLTDMPYTGPDGVYRNIWGMTAMMIFRLYQRSVLGVFEVDY